MLDLVGALREVVDPALDSFFFSNSGAEAVEGAPKDSLPASFLQGHPQVRFLIDRAAASALTRVRYPWLVSPIQWTPAMTRRAVIWLSRQAKKPVLKLLDEEPGISVLVLAADVGPKGPGPLCAALAEKYMGQLHVPLTIVPGLLSEAEIDAIS